MGLVGSDIRARHAGFEQVSADEVDHRGFLAAAAGNGQQFANNREYLRVTEQVAPTDRDDLSLLAHSMIVSNYVIPHDKGIIGAYRRRRNNSRLAVCRRGE